MSLCSSKKKLVDINTFDNSKLTTKQSFKILGIHVDSALRWDAHMDNLKTKLNKAVFAIRKCREICSGSTLRSIYFSYFNSNLGYGILFWGDVAG